MRIFLFLAALLLWPLVASAQLDMHGVAGESDLTKSRRAAGHEEQLHQENRMGTSRGVPAYEQGKMIGQHLSQLFGRDIPIIVHKGDCKRSYGRYKEHPTKQLTQTP
jgi:hypothetical protein